MMTQLLQHDVDPNSWWMVLASCFASIAVWAASKASPPLSPEQALIELTDRLRDPRKRAVWARRHPIRAWRNR